MSDPKRCSQSIGVWAHQCQRFGKVTEEGQLWCKQHAPSAVKAKQEKWMEVYHADNAARAAKEATEARHEAAVLNLISAVMTAYEQNNLQPELVAAVEELEREQQS